MKHGFIVRVVWFNNHYIAKSLPTNAQLVISGRVGVFGGRHVFESPEWELLEDRELVHTGRLVPIYQPRCRSGHQRLAGQLGPGGNPAASGAQFDQIIDGPQRG